MTRGSIMEVVARLWRRVSDAARFYAGEAKRSSDPVAGAYLAFLAAKKRSQLVALEKTVAELMEGMRLPHADGGEPKDMPTRYRVGVGGGRLTDAHDFAMRCCENDLSLLNSFMWLADAGPLRSILSVLVQLERDFLFDVQTAYLDFLSEDLAPRPAGISPGFARTVRHPSHPGA